MPRLDNDEPEERGKGCRITREGVSKVNYSSHGANYATNNYVVATQHVFLSLVPINN